MHLWFSNYAHEYPLGTFWNFKAHQINFSFQMANLFKKCFSYQNFVEKVEFLRIQKFPSNSSSNSSNWRNKQRLSLQLKGWVSERVISKRKGFVLIMILFELTRPALLNSSLNFWVSRNLTRRKTKASPNPKISLTSVL